MIREFKLNLAFLVLVALISFTIISTQNIKFWEVPLIEVIEEEVSEETQEITQEPKEAEKGEVKKSMKVKSKVWYDPSGIDPLLSVCATVCEGQVDETSQTSFPDACDDTTPIYTETCDSGDLMDTNDGLFERHTGGSLNWAGVKTRNNDTTVTDCLSIDKVEVCIENWLGASKCNAYSLQMAQNSSGTSHFVEISSTCPGTSANPGVTCTDVTSTFSWLCTDFFDGVGNTSGIITQVQRDTSGGGALKHDIDVLYFNVTYTASAGNLKPFIGNASINATLIRLNEWVCLNATAHDPDGDTIVVNATVWNTTAHVNYTMTDTGSTSCDGASSDDIYGFEVQGLRGGTWNFTHATSYDNQVPSNFNQTIVNRRWNVSDVPEITNIDFDDDFEPTPPDAIDLNAFASKNVFCNGTITDLDGGGDILKVNATIYDAAASSAGVADANASHYTNQSCFLSAADGDFRHFECFFGVRYFANNATWTCNATAYDSQNFQNSSNLVTVNATINSLVALSIPATMNFGTLFLGDTSLINKTNVTNAGNKAIDISIYGYTFNQTNSSAAFNCTSTTGIKSNITLDRFQYNVTDTTGAQCTNFGWGSNNFNLTNLSNEKSWTNFNLGKQTAEDTLMRNYTCWILQIPQTGEETIDPAGVCTGIISFTAVLDA